MYLTVKKINNNLRLKDLIQLFTFDTPIYKFKEGNDSIMLMYSTLSQIQLCLEMDGSCLIDPLDISLVEVLVPVVIKTKRNKRGRCLCIISDNNLTIDELETYTLPICFYISKHISGKYFYIVEFEDVFDFSNCRPFYDIFSFEDYLEALIYSGKL